MQPGTHLIIDLEDCNVRLDKVNVVRDFLNNLNKEVLKMRTLSGPHMHYICRDVEPEKNGVTGVLIFEESHVSIHTFSEADKPKLFLDAFSCKSFHNDVPDVIKRLINTFGGRVKNLTVLTR